MKIPILSDTLNSKEIYELLNKEMQNSDEVKIELEKEPEHSLPIDPTVTLAIVDTVLKGLAILVPAIVSIWLARKNKKPSTIVIKGTDGTEIQFPDNTHKEKIDEYVLLAQNLKAIKHIAIIEKG